MRTFFVIGFFISVSYAFPQGFQGELSESYSNLTPAEKNDLKAVFRNYRNYRNEQEFVAALKQRNPSLGARAEQKMIQMKQKVAGLSEESRGFVTEMAESRRKAFAQRLSGQNMDFEKMRQSRMEMMQRYRSLSPYAQEELRQTFPQAFQFMQARAQMFRGMFQNFMNARGGAGGGGPMGMMGMGMGMRQWN